MLHQLDKIREMTGRLLDISRIAAGRLSVALEQLDLGNVVRDVVGRIFPPAPGTPRVEVALDGFARFHRGASAPGKGRKPDPTKRTLGAKPPTAR